MKQGLHYETMLLDFGPAFKAVFNISTSTGSSVNPVDHHGHTPLHCGASAGAERCCAALIRAGILGARGGATLEARGACMPGPTDHHCHAFVHYRAKVLDVGAGLIAGLHPN